MLVLQVTSTIPGRGESPTVTVATLKITQTLVPLPSSSPRSLVKHLDFTSLIESIPHYRLDI